MFFSVSTTGKKMSITKSQIRGIVEAAASQRDMIRRKLNETQEIDKQLAEAIRETSTITSSLRDKLKSKVKITRRTVTSICQLVNDGVILLDWQGNVIEINQNCEEIMDVEKNNILHRPLNEILTLVQATQLSTGSDFRIDSSFFRELSESLILKADCDEQCEECDKVVDHETCLARISHAFETAGFDPQEDISLTIKPHTVIDPLKVSVKFSVLDNEPEKAQDMIFMFYVSCAPYVKAHIKRKS